MSAVHAFVSQFPGYSVEFHRVTRDEPIFAEIFRGTSRSPLYRDALTSIGAIDFDSDTSPDEILNNIEALIERDMEAQKSVA